MAKHLELYLGKVRHVGESEVRVSLWGSKRLEQGLDTDMSEEIIGELPRGYFPTGNLEVGQMFKYIAASRTVEMIPERELSKEELARIWEEVQRQIPLGE